MKALIVSLNAKYAHFAPAPYALGAGVLAFSEQKHEVSIWTGVVGKDDEGVLTAIADLAPDAVAFSVYIWNVDDVKRLLPRVREILPHSALILGGPEVSYSVEKTFAQMPDADYILSGEGEEPFARLLDALVVGEGVSGVKGCAYRTENGVFVPEPFVGVGTPPSPLDFGYAEALHGRIAYIESSRGCPFSCAFCLSGRCGGVRYFDVDRVERDILSLANADTRTVKFVDRTFNADIARAQRIIRFILSKREEGKIPKGVCFHFEIAGELLDKDTLALLESAPRGLFQLEIGLQSFHEKTLRAIHRAPVSDKLLENIKHLVAAGNLHVHIDLIAGLPHEDLATFRAGFDRAYALGAHMLQLGFLKFLHGAKMREEPENYPAKYAEDAPYTVRTTPVLSEFDLFVIAFCEEGCERLYNSGRYKETLKEALSDGASAFDLLRDAGKRLKALKTPYTLDDEIEALLSFFAKHLSEDRARDTLLADFLATNPSCYTPKALRREDERLARVKLAVDGRFPKKKDVRRAYAISYTEDVALYCDYDEKDPVTGRYHVRKVPLNDIFPLLEQPKM